MLGVAGGRDMAVLGRGSGSRHRMLVVGGVPAIVCIRTVNPTSSSNASVAVACNSSRRRGVAVVVSISLSSRRVE